MRAEWGEYAVYAHTRKLPKDKYPVVRRMLAGAIVNQVMPIPDGFSDLARRTPGGIEWATGFGMQREALEKRVLQEMTVKM